MNTFDRVAMTHPITIDDMKAETLRLHDLRHGQAHCERKWVELCREYVELIPEAGRSLRGEATDPPDRGALTEGQSVQIVQVFGRIQRGEEPVDALLTVVERIVADRVARVRALCDEWDRLSKGETATTRRIREALR